MAERARDPGRALVTPGPAAADVGGTPSAASPYSWATPSPPLLGPRKTLATPYLALAEAGGIQDSIPAVFGATPGLGLADAGGTLGPALAAFGGTPSLPPPVDWVISGLSPADVWETPGRVAAPSEETRAP